MNSFLGKKVFLQQNCQDSNRKQPTKGLLHSTWRKNQCHWKYNSLKLYRRINSKPTDSNTKPSEVVDG